jgi:hypothetical protein
VADRSARLRAAGRCSWKIETESDSRMSDSRFEAFEAFLARIYVDENSRRKFLANPRGEAAKAGLTPRQIEDVVKIDREGLEMFAASLKRKKQGSR